ncbi:hypothetical protein D3C71_1127500 [compost metagenome]
MFQSQFQRLETDPGERVGGDFQRLHAQPLEGLHGAVKARRVHGHDVARLADGADAGGQRFVTTGGHHQIAGAQLTAGIEHQAGDLLAQFEVAVDVVVIQTGHVLSTADPGEVAQQRFHGRAGDVGHAAAQLHHVFARYSANQLQHLIPLRDIHRPLRRAANRRQLRQVATDRNEVPGLGPWHGQPAVFQHPIGLLHRAQADPMLDAQRPHRRQPVTGAIEALFDTRAE